MGLLPDAQNCVLRMRRECFPRHRLQRKPLVSDPGMHHGTCVMRVPGCMSGSLTHCDGENVPGIPSACATRNFTYLVGGPLRPKKVDAILQTTFLINFLDWKLLNLKLKFVEGPINNKPAFVQIMAWRRICDWTLMSTTQGHWSGSYETLRTKSSYIAHG